MSTPYSSTLKTRVLRFTVEPKAQNTKRKETRAERDWEETQSKASRVRHQQRGGTRDATPAPGNAGGTLCVCFPPEGKINQEVSEELVFGHHCAAGEAPSPSTAQGAAEAGGAAAGGGVTPSAAGGGCAGGGSANRETR